MSSGGLIKRSLLTEYPRKGRATGGVATMQVPPRSTVTGAAVLSDNEDCLLIAESGQTARVTPEQLAVVGRDRKGSTGIKLDASDNIVRLVVLAS